MALAAHIIFKIPWKLHQALVYVSQNGEALNLKSNINLASTNQRVKWTYNLCPENTTLNSMTVL